MNSFLDFDRSLFARSGFIRAALSMACLMLSANALAANMPLISSASLKCAAPYGNASRGTQVVQTACGGGTAQQWKFQAAGTSFQLVTPKGSKLCMSMGSANEGAPAVLGSCDGQSQFDFRPIFRGYQVVARASGKCLSVEGDSTQDGARIIQRTCIQSMSQTWVTDTAVTASSSWTPLKTLTLVPVAAAHLPNGKLLFWSAFDRFNFGGDQGQTYTTLFNPATLTASETLVTNTGHDMFCTGIANLPDGRIHVSGGSSSQKTSLYNPNSNSWSVAATMNIARGYQGSVTLSDGSVLTYGGSWSGGLGGKNGEVWTENGGWRQVANLADSELLTADAAGIFRSDNHGWFFSVGNGRVFHAGPSQTMHWLNTVDSGSVTAISTLRGGGDAMNGNAVMYDVGRILTLGGASSYEDSPAMSTANVLDIRTDAVDVRPVAPMAFARAYHSSVVLPSGQVVVIGGQGLPRPFTEDQAVLRPELWDPRTEKFTQLVAMAVPRVYHSVALLLPDARVLTGGGGLCGSCTVNHPDVQILTPPYLRNPDGTTAVQPKIVGAPAQAALGSALSVTTDGPVVAFSLIRMSSITHSVNNEQRRVPVSFSATSNTAYSVNVPSDAGVVLPGYWMLFAMTENGVPSKAAIVQLHL
jgi:galactose oxidase